MRLLVEYLSDKVFYFFSDAAGLIQKEVWVLLSQHLVMGGHVCGICCVVMSTSYTSMLGNAFVFIEDFHLGFTKQHLYLFTDIGIRNAVVMLIGPQTHMSIFHHSSY